MSPWPRPSKGLSSQKETLASVNQRLMNVLLGRRTIRSVVQASIHIEVHLAVRAQVGPEQPGQAAPVGGCVPVVRTTPATDADLNLADDSVLPGAQSPQCQVVKGVPAHIWGSDGSSGSGGKGRSVWPFFGEQAARGPLSASIRTDRCGSQW